MHFYDRRFKPSPFGIARNKKAVIRFKIDVYDFIIG